LNTFECSEQYKKKSLNNSNEYVFANKVLKTQRFSDLQKQKLLGDTILILKARKSGAERELLDLGKISHKIQDLNYYKIEQAQSMHFKLDYRKG